MNNERRKIFRTQSGLSLIELMIAITLGLFLLAGVINLFVASRQSYQTQEALARMQEAGRFSMDFITQDLRRAGYWGGNADVSTLGPTPNASCAGTGWGLVGSQRASGLDGTAAGCACIIGHIPRDAAVGR